MNDVVRDHTDAAREIRVKAAQRELSEERRTHASRLLTIVILILVVNAVQTLAFMSIAKKPTVVFLPMERRVSPSVNTQELYLRDSGSAKLRKNKTPAAAVSGGSRESARF
jgi:hypothetical protein